MIIVYSSLLILWYFCVFVFLCFQALEGHQLQGSSQCLLCPIQHRAPVLAQKREVAGVTLGRSFLLINFNNAFSNFRKIFKEWYLNLLLMIHLHFPFSMEDRWKVVEWAFGV